MQCDCTGACAVATQFHFECFCILDDHDDILFLKNIRDVARKLYKCWKQMILLNNVSNQKNPPDELAQNVSKKNLSDDFFLNCPFESSDSYRVFQLFTRFEFDFSGRGNHFRSGFRRHSVAPSVVCLLEGEMSWYSCVVAFFSQTASRL